MRTLARLVVALLLIATALLGQEVSAPKASSSQQNKDTCSIAGLVVKASTGEPIKKAGVYLQKIDDPRSGYSAHTDATGHFAVEKIDSGRYNLRIERTGFVSQSYSETSATSRGAVLTLTPGREMKDMIFRLVPWGVISGRIADENGDPIPGTSVEAMRHVVDEGKRTLQAVQAAETNDLGEFRLYGLAKGRYFVRAQIRGEWQRSPAAASANDAATDETGYSPVYYPGTPDEARAATIEVIAGQEVPAIDFTLIPVRSFRVTGHVFDAVLGQPAKDCFVVLLRRDPNTSGFFFNDQAQASCHKGSFEFSSVPPGSYYVSAMSSSAGKRRVARAAVEVENSNVTDVGMTFVQGTNITGRILIEGHEAMDFSDVHLWLTDPEQYFNGGVGPVVRPDGTLTIENLAEGRYRIQTHSMPPGVPADFYLKDAQANGDSILDKALMIVAGGNQVSLEITMSSAGARVDGTVTDENDLPAAGATVALVPEEARRKLFRLYKDSTTDQYGKFILRGIAPGKYKVFSWKEVENNAWEDTDFLKPFEDQGKEIAAEENGRITLQLKLIATDKAKQSQ